MTNEEFQARVIELLEKKNLDHETRIAALERRNDRRTAIVSVITSIATILAAALAGCF